MYSNLETRRRLSVYVHRRARRQLTVYRTPRKHSRFDPNMNPPGQLWSAGLLYPWHLRKQTPSGDPANSLGLALKSCDMSLEREPTGDLHHAISDTISIHPADILITAPSPLGSFPKVCPPSIGLPRSATCRHFRRDACGLLN